MKFTKIAALVLSLSIVGTAIAACSNEPEPVSSDINIISTQGQNNGGANVTVYENAASENYVLTFRGTDLIVDTAFDDSKFSDSDYTYEQSASCSGVGLASKYFFGSTLYVELYPDSDLIVWAQIKDDTISTNEGIGIGKSKDEVRSVYGEPVQTTEFQDYYIKGSSVLIFTYNKDTGNVYLIDYTSTSQRANI